MSALVALTAVDATPVSPVSFTFNPRGKTKDGYWIFEQVTPAPSNALAAARLHVRLVREDMKPVIGSRLGGAARVHAKLWIPTMETMSTNDAGITPPPQVAYTCFSEVNYVLPERSTEQDRKNLRVLSANLTGSNASLQAMLYQLEDLW